MLHYFMGFHGTPSLCDVALTHDHDRTTCVCKDVYGTSVTNAIETIATQVCRDNGIDPITLVMIEQRENGDRHVVRFGNISRDGTFADPLWIPANEVPVSGTAKPAQSTEQRFAKLDRLRSLARQAGRLFADVYPPNAPSATRLSRLETLEWARDTEEYRLRHYA